MLFVHRAETFIFQTSFARLSDVIGILSVCAESLDVSMGFRTVCDVRFVEIAVRWIIHGNICCVQ